METSGKSRKKGRNKRITNSISRGGAFINRPPVLNREFEPAPQELQETLSSEDLDFDLEEQQAAKARPHKVKYTSCKVIQTGNNIEFIWRKGPGTKEVELEQPQPLKVNHWLRPTGTNLPNETISCQEPSEVEHPLVSSAAEKQYDTRPEPSEVAVSPTELQVAENPEETQVAVTLKEPQVSVIPREPHLAVVPEEPQVTVIPDVALVKVEPKQPQLIKPGLNSIGINHAIETELRIYLQELSMADPSHKVVFVNGQLGLPDALVRSIKERHLDQTPEPSQVPKQTQPPPVNPCPKSTDTNLQNDNICSQEIDEVEYPLFGGAAKKGAVASENQQLTYKIQPRGKVLRHIQWRKGPQLAVIPEEVEPEEEPQPLKAPFWVKSTETNFPNETIHCKEIEGEHPLLRSAAEKPQPEIRPQPPDVVIPSKEPQLAVTPKEPQLIVVAEKPQVDLTPKEPQATVIPKEPHVPEPEPQVEKMIAVPEIAFMQDKNAEIITLESEQEALLKEVEQLREMLQSQSALHIEADAQHKTRIKTFQLGMSEAETSEKEALCKVSMLVEAIKNEATHQKEAETSMACQREEHSNLMAALVKTEEGIKQETILWEEEKANLLNSIKEQQQILEEEITRNLRDSINNQSEESYRLVAVLVKAEGIKQETLQRGTEKTNLFQSLNEQQPAPDQEINTNQTRDTLDDLSEEDTRLLAALVKTEEDKKEWEKKKSTLLKCMNKQQQQAHNDKIARNQLRDIIVNQNEENTSLVGALVKAEESIKQETLQWEMEKTSLFQSLNEQQPAPDQEINTNETRDTLDDLSEEDTRLLAALVKTEEDKKEWEKKKSTILKCMNKQQQQAHNDEILVGALVKAEESIKQETLEWEEEKATVLQSMQQQQQDLETGREQMKERLDQVSQQVAAIVRKPRKPSLLRRFVRLFK